MPTSYMDDMQKALAQIDHISLLDKIAGFRRLDIANMSDAEISKAILDVLCWNGRFLYHTNIKKYPAGTRFFRVKKLDGSNIPNPRFRKYHDYWETPPEYINTYGRLNKPGEPLLYVSSDLLCSIKEVRIDSGSCFAAIQYTARQDIKVNIIGGEFDYDGLGMTDKRARLIHELYNGFLRDEFSRDVGRAQSIYINYHATSQMTTLIYRQGPYRTHGNIRRFWINKNIIPALDRISHTSC